MSFSIVIFLVLAFVLLVILVKLELSGKGSLDNPSPVGCFIVLAIIICLLGALICWYDYPEVISFFYRN